jgi:uncharacterized protein involved in outer membrane biogenesis
MAQTGKHRTGRTVLIVLGAVAVLLVAARLALSPVLTHYANQKLATLPDYQGHIDAIHLALWRGGATIEGTRLVKKTGKVPVPFLTVPMVDAQIQWKALFHGKLVAEILVDSPEINVVDGPTPESTQASISQVWLDTAKEYMPIDINLFTLRNGTLHFRRFDSEPKVDVTVTDIQFTARNLRNTEGKSEERFAVADGSAKVAGEAPATLHVDLDPLAAQPTFAMKAQMERLNMVRLNDLLNAYGKFDVKSGSFSVYTEVAASNGSFKGYVKPFFENVKVLQAEDKNKGPIRLLWETLVAGAKELLENKQTKDVATRIPVSGKFDKPDVGVWPTVVNLLSNAFIQALRQGIEGSVGTGALGK